MRKSHSRNRVVLLLHGYLRCSPRNFGDRQTTPTVLFFSNQRTETHYFHEEATTIQRPCRPRVPIHATVQVEGVVVADPLATVEAMVELHLATVEAAMAALPRAMAGMAHRTPRLRQGVVAVGWAMVVDSINNNKGIVVRVWESMKISKR